MAVEGGGEAHAAFQLTHYPFIAAYKKFATIDTIRPKPIATNTILRTAVADWARRPDSPISNTTPGKARFPKKVKIIAAVIKSLTNVITNEIQFWNVTSFNRIRTAQPSK
jgi:hypothetical protein